MDDLCLTGSRLTLRSMVEADAAALVGIVTQPPVGRNLFLFPPDWTVEAARGFIARTRFAGAPPFRLGVYLDDALIGSVGVSQGPLHDVYYFIDPAHQGHGYGREAMALLLDALFTRFGLTGIAADVFTDNPGSDHILRGLGFRRAGQGTGTSAARLEPAPIWLYRLTQPDFEAHR